MWVRWRQSGAEPSPAPQRCTGALKWESRSLGSSFSRGHLVGMGCSCSGSRCLCLELCIPLPLGICRRDGASAGRVPCSPDVCSVTATPSSHLSIPSTGFFHLLSPSPCPPASGTSFCHHILQVWGGEGNLGSLLKRLRGCSVPVFREQMIAIGGLPASPLPQPQVDSACRGHPHTAGVIASHHCYGDKRLGTVSTVVVSCLDPTEIPAGGRGTSVPSIATHCPSPGWPEAPRVGPPGGSGGQKLEAVGSCLPPPHAAVPHR